MGGTKRRIGFDASSLAFPAGGVRRYAHELFSRLPLEAPDVDFIAIGLPAGAALPQGTVAGPTVIQLPNNLARAAIALPLAVRQARVDLFHAPAYTAPLTGGGPIVLTIHDVSYERRPEFYAYRSDRLRRWFYRRSARRGRRIITDSRFSQAEIVAAYGINASRIEVVPLGVGPPFTPRGSNGRPPSLPEGVRSPYLLHVGDLHPRRDVGAAARAVIEIAQTGADGRAGDLAPQLVCAGRDYGSADDLRTRFAEAGVPELLVLTGPVSEAALVELYQNACLLLYPSRYEGFGLPVLEAMACGLPVIARKAGAVPEVLGDAGILVDEDDDRGMVRMTEMLVREPERRADLTARGLARAATFTWAETARQTMAVYRRCLPRE